MRYFYQLDSIRAISVILVIISHWLPENHLLNLFPNGVIGVAFFFILSGFLITWILFESKERNRSENKGNWKTTRSFIIRRAIRIFPIYYLYLIFLYGVEVIFEGTISKGFIYHFTYTSNFYVFKIQAWDGILSHLWSLSVEEQFYLFFPWLVLFVKNKKVLYSLIGLILIGIAVPIFIRIKFIDFLTISCFESLGLGALLAYVYTYKPKWERIFIRILEITGLLSFLLLLLFSTTTLKLFPGVLTAIVSFIGVAAITYVIYERKNVVIDYILDNKTLIFLGKISYGMYLYHLLIAFVYERFLSNYSSTILFNEYIRFFIQFFMLIVMSWFSWILIEKPIIKFKKYFQY